MSQTEQESNAVEGSKKSKSKKGLFIALTLILVVLITVVVFVLIYFNSKAQTNDQVKDLESDIALEDEDVKDRYDAVKEELKEGEEFLGAIYPLEIFIVNLSDSGVVRAEFQIEFEGRELPRKLYNSIPLLRDSVIKILSQKERQVLLSSEGMETLKKDIQVMINKTLNEELVKRILVTQFLVQ